MVAIGLETGVTLILEREATCQVAERAGVSIVGLSWAQGGVAA